MMLTLVGISDTGKKRVKERGAGWRVIDKRDSVQFSETRGPWLLIVPEGRSPDDLAARWVHGLNDTDFKVMPGVPDKSNFDNQTTEPEKIHWQNCILT